MLLQMLVSICVINTYIGYSEFDWQSNSKINIFRNSPFSKLISPTTFSGSIKTIIHSECALRVALKTGGYKQTKKWKRKHKSDNKKRYNSNIALKCTHLRSKIAKKISKSYWIKSRNVTCLCFTCDLHIFAFRKNPYQPNTNCVWKYARVHT